MDKDMGAPHQIKLFRHYNLLIAFNAHLFQTGGKGNIRHKVLNLIKLLLT